MRLTGQGAGGQSVVGQGSGRLRPLEASRLSQQETGLFQAWYRLAMFRERSVRQAVHRAPGVSCRQAAEGNLPGKFRVAGPCPGTACLPACVW